MIQGRIRHERKEMREKLPDGLGAGDDEHCIFRFSPMTHSTSTSNSDTHDRSCFFFTLHKTHSKMPELMPLKNFTMQDIRLTLNANS
mmetsp:Transcript_2306/g.8586  ORF Transcript_2306/g.8586 Transcript_2306/m.8586 type:complete len:87 (+) Transcript_2306:415-675(+)